MFKSVPNYIIVVSNFFSSLIFNFYKNFYDIRIIENKEKLIYYSIININYKSFFIIAIYMKYLCLYFIGCFFFY